MSPYILDADILTLLRQSHPIVSQRVASHPPNEVMITVISVEEQLSGWYTQLLQAKTRNVLASIYQRLTDSVRFVGRLPILSFPEPAILRYENLNALKLNIRKKDLCIAAIVLESGGTLITHNLRDFQRVPSLLIENWAA
jgi:tRNA(fMet)-specific endonuclease VapC